MKKILNLIALAILLGVEIITPMTYATGEVEEPHPNPLLIGEGKHEVVGEVGTIDSSVNIPEGEQPVILNESEGFGIISGEDLFGKISGENVEILPIEEIENPQIESESSTEEQNDVLLVDDNWEEFLDKEKVPMKEETEEESDEESEEVNKLLKIDDADLQLAEVNNMDIVIQATATEADQTLKINKYFANNYTVNRGDGSPIVKLISDTTHMYSATGVKIITLSLTGDDSKWTFKKPSFYARKPLVPKSGTTVTGLAITLMPPLADGFGVSATNPGSYFFENFNYDGAITSLPEGSFDTANYTGVGDDFFWFFNYNGALKSLPEGSFNISKITKVGGWFFYYFNSRGALTSLPNGSFNTSNITVAPGGFFRGFNCEGSLTSLPEGSFDVSNIVAIDHTFFYEFNRNGAISILPDSFKINSTGVSKSSAYAYAFNSPYTINRKVSDLLSGITALPSFGVFSENQPGICGVNARWLMNSSRACKIVYDANGGIGTTTGGYHTNTTIVLVGSGIQNPVKKDSLFNGWYTLSEGGEKIETIIFPDMDGKTVYAHWYPCTHILNGGNFTGDNYVPIRENSRFEGWYIDSGFDTEFDENQTLEGNITLYAKYNCDKFYYESEDGQSCVQVERKLNGGEILSGSDNPIRENSRFEGWYIDSGFDTEFDENQTLEGNITLYAKYNCDKFYYESEDGQSCEITSVKFNANGGKFFDKSDKYSILANIIELPIIITKILHTANLDDNGDYTGKYGGVTVNGYPTSLNPYTSGGITMYPISSPSIINEQQETNKFKISLKYGGSPYCNPGYISIWTGNRIGSTSTGLAVLYISEFPNFGKYRTEDIELQGDSFTIYQNGGCPSYGFFAMVSWIGGTVYEAQYAEDSFDNIPTPIRDGYSFVGRYLSDGTQFDPTNVGTGNNTYVYAKWEKNHTNNYSGGGGGHGGGGSSSTTSKTDDSKSGTETVSQTESQNQDKTTEKEDKVTENELEKDTGEKIPPVSPLDEGGLEQLQGQDKSSNAPPYQAGDGVAEGDLKQKDFSPEQKSAYQFAKSNGITTTKSIQDAKMNSNLTRIQMAKMLSQYAINVMGKTPDTTQKVNFRDVSNKQDSQYDNGVTLAYQLGIMGQNMKNNKFRPNDTVTRAEFVTALSRLLYNTPEGNNEGTSKYYQPHMAKLYNEGIINVTNPNIKEQRGYVMIMLMRSAENSGE